MSSGGVEPPILPLEDNHQEQTEGASFSLYEDFHPLLSPDMGRRKSHFNRRGKYLGANPKVCGGDGWHPSRTSPKKKLALNHWARLEKGVNKRKARERVAYSTKTFLPSSYLPWIYENKCNGILERKVSMDIRPYPKVSEDIRWVDTRDIVRTRYLRYPSRYQ
ncbi:hypothetical protein B0H11DRAFT_1899793 [Mycena galericulata]|nr:hypothetical protein B0H11DRAFT_1899793 [Mycena galericulata]